MLSWRLAAGTRKYKEAILPSIAYIIVLIGLQIFSIWKKGDFNVSDFMGFFPLYLTLLIGYTIIDNMKYNELGDYFCSTAPSRSTGRAAFCWALSKPST